MVGNDEVMCKLAQDGRRLADADASFIPNSGKRLFDGGLPRPSGRLLTEAVGAGQCTVVACPEHTTGTAAGTSGTGSSSGCTVAAGYSGSVTATTTGPLFYSSTITAIACPSDAGTAATETVVGGCTVAAGYSGSVTATTTGPLFYSSDVTDIDECTAGSHNCDANAACTNNVGSFTCVCNSGYIGNGQTCTVHEIILCSTCPHGQISTGRELHHRWPSEHGLECTACKKGRFSTADHTECIDCPAGKYHVSTGAACMACNEGKFAEIAAATTCSHCPSGQYQDGSDYSSCDECAQGKWTNGLTGMTVCASIPTAAPTEFPTASPTMVPTAFPTAAPTTAPTAFPTTDCGGQGLHEGRGRIVCCTALTSECIACSRCMTEREFCNHFPTIAGCETCTYRASDGLIRRTYKDSDDPSAIVACKFKALQVIWPTVPVNALTQAPTPAPLTIEEERTQLLGSAAICLSGCAPPASQTVCEYYQSLFTSCDSFGSCDADQSTEAKNACLAQCTATECGVEEAVALVIVPQTAVSSTMSVSGLTLRQVKKNFNIQLALTNGFAASVNVDASKVKLAGVDGFSIGMLHTNHNLESLVSRRLAHLTATTAQLDLTFVVDIPTADETAAATMATTISVQCQALSQYVRQAAAELGILADLQLFVVDTSSVTSVQDTRPMLPPDYDATQQPSTAAPMTTAPATAATLGVHTDLPGLTPGAESATPAMPATATDDVLENAQTYAESKIISTGGTYQMGAFPYLHGGGTWNIKPSVHACMEQCKQDSECKFGTFVDRKGVLHTFSPAEDFTREGECWLSKSTHTTNLECGIDCLGFKKIHVNAPTPAPSPAPTPVTAEGAPCSCTCDPRTDPSMYTTCHLAPFTYHIQVTHTAAAKHQIRMHDFHKHGKTQHVCKMLSPRNCRCCDCTCHTHKVPIRIKEVGFGYHTAVGPFLFDGGQFNIKASKAECQDQCMATTECKVGTYITNSASDGVGKGECWLSAHHAAKSICEMPCESFIKEDAIIDQVDQQSIQYNTPA
jgi:hypothetical protein